MSDRILLLVAAIGLFPLALSYGLIPSVTLPYMLGFSVEAIDLIHVFRAIMGFYLASITFWIAGALIASLTRSALWSLLIFMGGLATGRAISLPLDGVPNFVFLFSFIAEITFATLAAIRLKINKNQ